VADRTGVSDVEVGRFFSIGMLLNVAAALHLERMQDLCAEMSKSPDLTNCDRAA